MKKTKLRELDVIFRDRVYQDEFLATSMGREAFGLQQQAWHLEGLGQVDRACALLQRAAALIPEEDDGAAASSIRHDLAHMLSQACRPDDWHSLETAIRLLRRALESPARQAQPMRQAQSENQLAVCLRRLARRAGIEQRRRMREEVERLYRSVLFLTGRSGMLGSKLMAETHLNLGNFLAYEEGDTERALLQYERAISVSLRARAEGHDSMRHVLCRTRLVAAEVLRIRGRKKDLKAAERYAKEALQQPEKGREDHGWLELAEIALAGDVPDPKRAREYLTHVRTGRLDEAHLRIQHAELLWRSGDANEALGVLNDWIKNAIHARSRTIADFEADAAALEFQPAAALAARILARDKADAVGAFLCLENASGLRFAEVLSSFAWRPREPLTRVLQREWSQRMTRAYALEVFARSIWRLEPDAQRKNLESVLEGVRQEPSAEEHGEMTREDKDFLVETLQAAISAPVPCQHLSEKVREDTARVASLKAALCRHDAGYAEVQRVIGSELEREELETLLRESPGQVLVRLSLRDDLLAVAVWLEGGQVVARSTSVPLPDGLLGLLHEISSQGENIDFGRLSALMARVDVSPVLPEGRRPRAVLLPSNRAASLPLAVLGPTGSRLIDRFDSLVWLPCLFPLRTRPAASDPRTGHLVIDPETTQSGSIAFARPLDGECRLSGFEVTLDRLKQVAAGYESLCIYTHGSHKPGEMPALMLPGEQWMDVSRLFGQLAGLTRMEIWACQTGANHPVDPFSPPADEGFGLDFQLLMSGVRSAIGTLWSVPQFPTAAIVRHYRRRLSEGADPAVALLDAQRWWEAEGLPLLAKQFRQGKEHGQAVADFVAELDGGADEAILLSEGTGNGASSPRGSPEWIRAFFGCPAYWGAIRFVGLPDRGPLESWSEIPERPLTEEEHQEVERCLSVEPGLQGSFREQLEAMLAAASGIAPDVAPTAEQALVVARLLRERISGSQRDNLLMALAWLHEVLAAPDLMEEVRLRLSVEAAHLWLEVASDEQFPASWPNPVALARAERLLEAVPQSGGVPAADGLAARALLHFLRSSHSPEIQGLLREPREAAEALLSAPIEALELIGPALDGAPAESYEALRIATIAVELLPSIPVVPESLKVRVLLRAREVVSRVEVPLWGVAAWQRLRAALGRFDPDTRDARASQQLATPRELVAATRAALMDAVRSPSANTVTTMKLFSESFGQLESALWGYPSDNRFPLVTTTGTPGAAYRELLGFYLHCSQYNHPREAAHALACLQYACDLRLAFLGRLAWLAPRLPEDLGVRFRDLSTSIRRRQAVHIALADASLLLDPEGAREGLARPHPMDPYALPAQALGEGMKEPTGFTAWNLAATFGQWPEGLQPPRTAAFAAFLVSRTQEAEAAGLWSEVLEFDQQVHKHFGSETHPGFPQMLDPSLKLETNEEMLGSLPEGFGMLGLAQGPLGELFVMAQWSTRRGRGGRVQRLMAVGLVDALVDLLKPTEEDNTLKRGLSGRRREAWSKLEAALAPALDSLLKEAQREQKLFWGLIAPGALRALPLLGIRLGDGQPLAEHVEGLAHLPSHGFGATAIPRSEVEIKKGFTACLLTRDKRGTTCFGEASVASLRRARPPELVLDPAQPLGNTLVELETLVPRMEEVRTLRLYGIGDARSCNDTTASLFLEAYRPLTDRHTHHLFFSRCRVVELWACTSGQSDIERVLFDRADRMPGLVSSFLASGALAVIDLAWPVHDIVKALVCEQYGWQTNQLGHGAELLARSVWGTGAMLDMLRQQPLPATVREVLSLLDAVRRTVAQPRGVKLEHIVPFEALAESPLVAGMSAAELVEELCQPVHLGAFRWWGA